jgi:NarL family two-component system response regulator LiaR
MIRVVVADDHAVVRQGLRFMLERQPDMAVIGEGADGAEAVALAGDLVPDVVLLDLLMPNTDDPAVIREIKRLTPTTQSIVLTSYYEDDQILGAIKAGALSYLLKDVGPRDPITAVRAAARGESTLHPLVATRLLRDVRQQAASPLQDLTPREVEVLTHLARGRSDGEIAQALVIGEGTVKMHVSNILSKLHLADRTQAAIYALQHRLVPLDQALDDEQPQRAITGRESSGQIDRGPR